MVRRTPLEKKTKGGIIIPDTAKEKPNERTVIAVGEGRILDDGQVRKNSVNSGNRITFGKYAGTEIKLDGEEMSIIREDDILAVVVEEG